MHHILFTKQIHVLHMIRPLGGEFINAYTLKLEHSEINPTIYGSFITIKRCTTYTPSLVMATQIDS